ncbi:MAG: hypothetical protein KH135_02490 [Firmicutes bacterium]|nr:hypothetical protein [Bacillota bacterium]
MKKKQQLWDKAPFQLSWLILTYFLCVLFFFHIFKMFKINHALVLTLVISISLPALYYSLQSKEKLKKQTIIVLMLYFLLCIGMPFLFSRTYDLTADGNTYHKLSIGYLRNGWNPLYQSTEQFEKMNDLPDSGVNHKWMNHYPKATWITSAVMYEMTGYIESGKCITTLLILAMGLLSFSYLSTFLNKKQSFILSVLLALNPIILAQLFNYYVDGIMGICFFMEVIVLLNIDITKKQDIRLWIYLLAICSIFINLKFTGLLYSGMIAAVFYFYWLYKNRKEKNFWNDFKRITIHFTVMFSIAIFVIGSSSYVRNTIVKHNPLYPLIGKDKVDIITTMQPNSFKKASSIEKFVISMFSRTENVTYGGNEPRLKFPIKIYKSEIEQLSVADIRIAGFGPWSACFFVLGTALLIVEIYILYRKDKTKLKFVFLPLTCIFLTSIFVGENWWARYVPQLYLIPWFAICLMFYLKIDNAMKSKILKLFGYILMIIIIVNASFYFYQRGNDLKSFKKIRSDLYELSLQDKVELQLSDPAMLAFYYNLDDAGIKYHIINKELCEKEFRYVYSWRFKVKNNE